MKHRKSAAGFGKYWLMMFLAAGLLYAIFYIKGLSKDVMHELVISWPPLLGAFFLQFSFWAISSLLWKGLVEKFSHHKVPFLESYFQLCLVNLGKYFPGKVWGMIARGAYLKQRYAISSQAIIQTTYVEQLFLLGSGASLACMLYGVLYSSPPAFALAFVFFIATITGSTHLQSILKFLDRAIPRLLLSARFGSPDTILTFWQSLGYSLLYAVVWVFLGAVLYAIYFALFPVAFSTQQALATVLSCVVGFTAGFLAIFAPGGVGVREAVSSSILAGFMPLADAVMLMLIFRIWLAFLELGSTGLSYLIIRVANTPEIPSAED